MQVAMRWLVDVRLPVELGIFFGRMMRRGYFAWRRSVLSSHPKLYLFHFSTSAKKSNVFNGQNVDISSFNSHSAHSSLYCFTTRKKWKILLNFLWTSASIQGQRSESLRALYYWLTTTTCSFGAFVKWTFHFGHESQSQNLIL